MNCHQRLFLPIFVIALSATVLFGITVAQNIKIGGLLDIADIYEETAFRHAVDRENGRSNNIKLVAQIEKLDDGDSFFASKTVCSLLENGVIGIFGPQSTASLSHIHSVCEVLGIPHIETKWDFRSAKGSFLINLYPHPNTMKMAYADVILRWGWSKIIILYESQESLERLDGILQLTGSSKSVANEIVIQQLPNKVPTNPDENIFWPLMKRLKDAYPDFIHVILDCATEKIPQILKAADQSGMTRDSYKYFLTTLDIRTLKEEDLKLSDVNITALSLVNPDDPIVLDVVNSWNLWKSVARSVDLGSSISGASWLRQRNNPYNAPQTLIPSEMPDLRNGTLRVETALIYDAVTLFIYAVREHFKLSGPPIQQQFQFGGGQQQTGLGYEFKPISCETPIASDFGSSLMSAMTRARFRGLTGQIELDTDGFRHDVRFDILEVTKKGFAKIGEWDSISKIKFTRSDEEISRLKAEELRKAHFIVASVIGAPYFIEDAEVEGGYKGFVVDLMNLLKQNLGFNYEFKRVSEHGSSQADGKWSGAIGEILNDTADICIGDVSITYDRGQVIDFTTPFMNLGISILYTKPIKKPPELFSFLEPFHTDVWIYMATAYLGVSLLLFVLARISPDEWNSSHICDENPQELELTLHLINSLWFTIGSLMQQGSDIAPRAPSTRIVAGIWWFFTLIMISSYTANLAAFLTSEGLEEGIKDINDLPKQSKVKYGTQKSGSTRNFFKHSSFPLYMEINKNMEAMKPPPFVSNSQEGREMVLKSDGNYAFFMESVSIEYVTERFCKLTQLGTPLDQKGYGIGLKKGSRFRDAFTTQVLNLSENGEIERLKALWWKDKIHGGGQCTKETVSSGGAQALTLSHVGGVFVVLLGGCILAIIMSFIEYFWKTRKLALQGGKSVWTEIGKELKFALLCQGETKPIRNRESLNPTINSEAESTKFMVNTTRNSSMEQ